MVPDPAAGTSSGKHAPQTGPQPPTSSDPVDRFETLAGGQDPGIVREFIDFLRYNKKWWLTPIVVVTLVLVGLAFLAPSPVAPFIYALF